MDAAVGIEAAARGTTAETHAADSDLAQKQNPYDLAIPLIHASNQRLQHILGQHRQLQRVKHWGRVRRFAAELGIGQLFEGPTAYERLEMRRQRRIETQVTKRLQKTFGPVIRAKSLQAAIGRLAVSAAAVAVERTLDGEGKGQGTNGQGKRRKSGGKRKKSGSEAVVGNGTETDSLRKKRSKKGERGSRGGTVEDGHFASSTAVSSGAQASLFMRSDALQGLDEEAMRRAIWQHISRNVVPSVARAAHQSTAIRQGNSRRIGQAAAGVGRRSTGSRQSKPTVVARRALKEMLLYWKRNEREERELRKRAEKEAAERRRQEEEAREARRQAKKLNFLITQTELYSHFVGRKQQRSGGNASATAANAGPRLTKEMDFADVEDADITREAERLALQAAQAHQARVEQFDTAAKAPVAANGSTAAMASTAAAAAAGLDFMNPSTLQDAPLLEQPALLQVTLKGYQVRGLTWLASLYEQGINGILADEMGLGKTVQAISLLAHLAERQGTWGPFLVVTPASTLHNWQQEFTRFVPALRVLPYWGSVADRRVLRASCMPLWTGKRAMTRDTPFHVLITSYQLAVSDESFLSRVRWQYMVLDEAQAIKSAASARWRTLLALPCRNRLLITGTPIQNSMQELWALLHFIMPTLFDSHAEFSDWFARDIESHAERGAASALSTHQVARLHMILKPFMLRRVKTDVEHELAGKIEHELICDMSPRQRRLYRGIRDKLPLLQLLGSANASTSASTSVDSALMNLVMQFRKVCNHPELLEPTPSTAPLILTGQSSASGGALVRMASGPIEYRMPRVVAEIETERSVPGRELLELYTVARDRGAVPVVAGDAQGARSLLKVPFPVEPMLVESLAMAATERALASPAELVVSSSAWKAAQSAAATEIHSHRAGLLAAAGLRLDRAVQIPQMEKFIRDSGKMARLDALLATLRPRGHRVLIYNQMTRMIDLMEQYLQHRSYPYLRLDGSTPIAARRDLVHSWQTDPTLFVFLLSTRAGGLGINLTAADTVIFYDSDWNPTVDQQAMDRAHRLGQTKQVNVYRLLTRSSVEERVMQRARQKDEIHRVVISGGSFQNDGRASSANGSASKDELMSMLLVDEDLGI